MPSFSPINLSKAERTQFLAYDRKDPGVADHSWRFNSGELKEKPFSILGSLFGRKKERNRVGQICSDIPLSKPKVETALDKHG